MSSAASSEKLTAQLHKLAQRDRELLDELGRSLERRDSELTRLTSMLEEQRRELEASELARAELERQLAASQDSIKRRFEELAQLTLMLENSKPVELPEAAAPPPRFFPMKASRLSRRMKRDIALIKRSGLFDAKWYLEQYPDIAEDKRLRREPALHYLLHGGHEGRNPGPAFDSVFYLATYADVKESGENPLVHYLKYGQAEQRLPSVNTGSNDL